METSYNNQKKKKKKKEEGEKGITYPQDEDDPSHWLMERKYPYQPHQGL